MRKQDETGWDAGLRPVSACPIRGANAIRVADAVSGTRSPAKRLNQRDNNLSFAVAEVHADIGDVGVHGTAGAAVQVSEAVAEDPIP